MDKLGHRLAQMRDVNAALLAVLLVSACGNDPPAPPEVDAGVVVTPLPSSCEELIEAGADGANEGADGGGTTSGCDATECLRITEVVSQNDGVALDEVWETEDYLELTNTGSGPIELADYVVSDTSSKALALPRMRLLPGESVVVWADEQVDQGTLHADFKISSGGDTLRLWRAEGESCALTQELNVPPLDVNETLAHIDGEYQHCRYATPGQANPAACVPPAPLGLEDNTDFEPYEWEEGWGGPSGPLTVQEALLFEDGFVELRNRSNTALELADYSLRVASLTANAPWPTAAAGAELTLPALVLEPGELVTVDVSDAAVALLAASPAYEGVLTLFERSTGAAVERVDFMRWPAGAALARFPDADSPHIFCQAPTPGAANDGCDPLPSRDVGDRVRHLRTPGDFEALARGGTELDIASVKFVVDLQAGGAAHLLSADWALHYTFIREQIYGQPELDRCDEAQNAEFNAGWTSFSQTEYFVSAGRRFYLGTLVRHGSNGLQTLEFAEGDAISAAQMRDAFFMTMRHVSSPQDWKIRPRTGAHLSLAQALNGQVPLVGPNAPFVGQTVQALTKGVGYGTLTYVSAAELSSARLGRDVILVTNDVPNDIPFVGGLITEAFQTPLAHVNVLSQSRGTPNMALRDAHTHPELAPLFGKLVRLEVSAGDFTLAEATAVEAAEFWDAQSQQDPLGTPRLDTSVRGVQPLGGLSLDAIPIIGAKAAQLAELEKVVPVTWQCRVPMNVPPHSFAIPVVHSLEHYDRSGVTARVAELLTDMTFRTDPLVRAAELATLRDMVNRTPVEPELLEEVTDAVRERFGSARVRFRSSSNAEDLPGFNGAGLYKSTAVELDDPDQSVSAALHLVWASLWSQRAYDEREFAGVNQEAVAMGVLVDLAYQSERANGVAISRDLLDPTYGHVHTISAQLGEASVTNPAPGVTTEQLSYNIWRNLVTYQSRSSFNDGAPVLSGQEILATSCALTAIHDHFRPLLDPESENKHFAMEVEYKFVGPRREFIIKQARPHRFNLASVPADCREL